MSTILDKLRVVKWINPKNNLLDYIKIASERYLMLKNNDKNITILANKFGVKSIIKMISSQPRGPISFNNAYHFFELLDCIDTNNIDKEMYCIPDTKIHNLFLQKIFKFIGNMQKTPTLKAVNSVENMSPVIIYNDNFNYDNLSDTEEDLEDEEIEYRKKIRKKILDKKDSMFCLPPADSPSKKKGKKKKKKKKKTLSLSEFYNSHSFDRPTALPSGPTTTALPSGPTALPSGPTALPSGPTALSPKKYKPRKYKPPIKKLNWDNIRK